MTILFEPRPDIERLLAALRRECVEPVPFFEINAPCTRAFYRAVGLDYDPNADVAVLDAVQAVCMARLGFDFTHLNFRNVFDFPVGERKAVAAPEIERDGLRRFFTADLAPITSWEEFDQYPWPDPEHIDFSRVATVKRQLPDGMGLCAHLFGPFETLIALLGYEEIAYVLYDQPDLFRATADRIGEILLRYTERFMACPEVDFAWMGEDMGHRSGLLLSPAVLRAHVFPWHRRIVAVVHASGRPVVLHSCGQIGEVYEDILAVGFDAKHSFEDAIEPVWSVKARIGERIAILGGFDMDKLVRFTPEQVAVHTRLLLERCGTWGYALGSGNSLAHYIPVENYLAMLNAARM